MSEAAVFEKNRFLRSLSTAQKRRLLPLLRERKIARGERVWSEGESADEISFVTRGRVKLVKTTEGGRDAILEMVMPGELLCASPTFAHLPHCCAGVATEETHVVSLRRADVLDLIEDSPLAARELIREVGCKMMALCERVEELSSGQVEQRIAMLLLKLAKRAGVVRPGEGTWVPVPLSRQDLADLCGTTVETAIRVMSGLGRRNLVRSDSQGFLIMDIDGLEDAAGKRERVAAKGERARPKAAKR